MVSAADARKRSSGVPVSSGSISSDHSAALATSSRTFSMRSIPVAPSSARKDSYAVASITRSKIEAGAAVSASRLRSAMRLAKSRRPFFAWGRRSRIRSAMPAVSSIERPHCLAVS